MAGIIISGGTYSGSGDVTTDWVKIMNVADGWFIAPDGNLTLVANTGGYSMQTALPTGASAGFHSNGGTVVFAADGTNPMINVDGFNGMGHFYNIQTTLATTRYHTRIKATGTLTIDAGATFESSRMAYGTNNTYVDFDGNARVTGSYNASGLSSDGTGDTFSSLYITSAGSFEACSGATTITGDDGNGYGVYTAGSDLFKHNSGSVVLNPVVDRLQALYFNDESNPAVTSELYDLTILSGTAAYDDADASWVRKVKAWNDLTVDAGRRFRPDEIDNSNFFLDVVGLATISGTLGHSSPWGGTAIPITLGALDIKSGGTYEATTGTTSMDITSRFDGSASKLCWVLAAGGTYTHNDGTVDIHCAGGATPVDQSLFFSPNTGSFYDLEVQVPEGRYLYMQSGDDLLVDNDLTIETPPSGGSIGTLGRWGNTTGFILVSGTATIEDQGKIRWGADNPSNYGCTFGTLDIQSGGIYEATPGTTLIKSDFSQQGTYTHNSGKLDLDNGTNLFLGSADLLTGANALYDLDVSSGQVMIDDCDMDIEGDVGGGNSLVFYNGGTMTCGTDSSQCTFDTPLGIYSTGWQNGYIKAKNPVQPVIMLSAGALSWRTQAGRAFYASDVDFSSLDITIPSGANWILSGQCDFGAVTLASSSTFSLSGQRAQFSGDLTVEDDSTMIVSGGMLVLDGAASYIDENDATISGRTTANLWLDFDAGEKMSPGGSNLNSWYNSVFWTGLGYINQDNICRGSNLIVAGTLDANDRPVGHPTNTSRMIEDMRIAAGGSVIDNTGGFYISPTGSFNNAGGIFGNVPYVGPDIAYAVDTSDTGWLGTTYYEEGLGNLTNATYEVWFKSDLLSGWNVFHAYLGYYFDMQIDYNTFKVTYHDGAAWNYLLYDNLEDIYNDNKWHHFAWTFTSGDDCNLYLDGKLFAVLPDESANGYIRDVEADSTGKIGMANDKRWGFQGTLNSMRLWDVTRTQQEIMETMFTPFSGLGASVTGSVVWDYTLDGNTTALQASGALLTNAGYATNSTLSLFTSGAGVIPQWASGGAWTAGGTVSSSAPTITIGKRGAYATEFGSSYFPTGSISLMPGANFVSKAHSGTSAFYVDSASGNTFEFDKMSLEPGSIDRTTHLGGSDMSLLSGDYTYIFNEGENDQGTAKDTETLTVNSPVTVKALTGVDFYVQDFDLRPGASYPRTPAYDGVIHDDGSLPQEYEPIDFKQHVDDAPIDAGLAID